VGRVLTQVLDTLTLPSRLAENALFQNWIIRRQVQVFRGSTTKVAYFFAVLFSRLALIDLLATLFLFLAFLYQRQETPRVPDWLRPLEELGRNALGEETLRLVPEWTLPIWILILIVMVSLAQTSRSLKKQFARKERTKE